MTRRPTTRARLECRTCTRQFLADPDAARTCPDCQAAAATLRRPRVDEWAQLATDAEVAAGHAAYASGRRRPIDLALEAENTARRNR